MLTGDDVVGDAAWRRTGGACSIRSDGEPVDVFASPLPSSLGPETRLLQGKAGFRLENHELVIDPDILLELGPLFGGESSIRGPGREHLDAPLVVGVEVQLQESASDLGASVPRSGCTIRLQMAEAVLLGASVSGIELPFHDPSRVKRRHTNDRKRGFARLHLYHTIRQPDRPSRHHAAPGRHERARAGSLVVTGWISAAQPTIREQLRWVVLTHLTKSVGFPSRLLMSQEEPGCGKVSRPCHLADRRSPRPVFGRRHAVGRTGLTWSRRTSRGFVRSSSNSRSAQPSFQHPFT